MMILQERQVGRFVAAASKRIFGLAQRRGMSQESKQPLDLGLKVPTYFIWGSGTDVGKTLVSCGICDSASRRSVRFASQVLPTSLNSLLSNCALSMQP